MASPKNTTDQAPGAGGAAPGASRPAPEWGRIELDYRAGIKSLRQIADEQGISEGAIRKRAKRDGWTRDLSCRIQDKADQLVRNELVRSEVRTERAATERQVVEINAQAVADVRLAHRQDIQRSRSLCMSLLEELQLQTTRPELFEEIEKALAAREDGVALPVATRAKLQEGLTKAMSLSGRSSTMRSLAESLRVLVGLEREAWGIKSDGDGEGGPVGVGRELTDAERAVRMSRLLAGNPEALAAILGGGKA